MDRPPARIAAEEDGGMRRIALLILLAACGAPTPPGPYDDEPRFYPGGRPAPAASLSPGQAARDRAAELACIRQGEAAEAAQPWLGALSMRAAVIGARVRNDCLDAYRRNGAPPG
ncbi:hypothetical protein [Pseudoroseomonas sp. WGS1072]|uniref:hypothetical protein n=1 Tax=Roseomonas sp. WGS1072 TaxID=3366816 RepID=UPI003BF0BC8E